MDLTTILGKGESLAETLGGKVSDLAGLIGKLVDDYDIIVAKAKALGHEIGNAASPVDLFDAVNKSLGDAQIQKVFADAGAADLLGRLKAAAAAFDKKVFPDEVRTLLKPLGDFEEAATGTDAEFPAWTTGKDPGRLRWSKDGKLTPLPKDPALGDLQLSASFDADCEAGSLWFYADDKVPAKGLVRIGLAGSLTASLGGGIPFSGLGALKGEAGGGCQAHLFWRKAPAKIYVQALAEIVSAPVNVFSLDDVWNAAQHKDFTGAILAIDGHASVDIDLAVAREYSAEGLFDARAGLTVKVELARKAAYELSVLKVDTGLRLVLSHSDDDAANWGVGLALDLDPGPITRRVADVVGAATDHWDAALKTVRPFLSPGTWIRDHLTGQFESLMTRLTTGLEPAIAAALGRDLRLAMGYDSDEPGVAAVLVRKITDAIASVEGVIAGDVNAIADQVVARLNATLPSMVGTPLSQRVKDEVLACLAALKADFDAVAKGVAKASPADAVDAALKKLGVQVAGAANAVDARFKGIADQVDKTDKLIHKISAAVQDAAKGKISARLSFERQRLDQEQYEFAGVITAPTDATRAIYRGLLTGRLDAVARLFAPGAVVPADIILDEKKSSVRRFSMVSTRFGYDVVILGLQLSGSSTVTGQADLTLTLGGDISLKAQALAKRANTVWGDGRSTNLIQSYGLVLSQAEGEARLKEVRKSLGLDLTTDRSDTDLKVKEVVDYLQLMADMKLIDRKRIDNMQDYVRNASLTRGGPNLPGTINVAMTFSADEVDRLLARGYAIASGSLEAREAAAKVTYDFALGNLLASGEWTTIDFVDWVGRYYEPKLSFKDPTPEAIAACTARLFANREVTPKDHRTGKDPLDAHFGPGVQRWEELQAFQNLLTGLWTLSNAKPRGLNDPDVGKWDEQRYRDQETAIGRCAIKWLGTNVSLFGFNKSIDQCTVALMATLAGLARPRTAQDTFDPMFKLTLILGKDAKDF